MHVPPFASSSTIPSVGVPLHLQYLALLSSSALLRCLWASLYCISLLL